MYFTSGTCSPPLVLTRFPPLVLAQRTRLARLELAPLEKRLALPRCIPPLALVQRMKLELALRKKRLTLVQCTPPLMLSQRAQLELVP